MKKIALHGSKNVIHAQLRRYRELRKLTQDQQRMVTDYEFACLCQVLQVSERDLLADFYNPAES